MQQTTRENTSLQLEICDSNRTSEKLNRFTSLFWKFDPQKGHSKKGESVNQYFFNKIAEYWKKN